MKIWLLEPSVAAELRAARDAGLAPTAEQQAAYEARERSAIVARDGVPRNLTVAGDVAEIRVSGVLTEKLDFFAFLFGGGNTTYESIRSAIAAAEADPNVRRVVYLIASPGGTVEGLFETLAAIDSATKPASVRASQATSAAYAIAAVAGKIAATTPAALFGSIGVAASFLNLEEIIDITNTASPDKRPDLSTEEGKAVVRRELDGIFDVFADAIAQGRGTTAKDVAENFGRGAVMVAKEAKQRGMIDMAPTRIVQRRAEDDAAPVAEASASLETPRAEPVAAPPQDASAASGGAQEKRKMDENQLKAQHPELYAAMIAKGEEQGVAKERKRVNAHLKLAKTSGAMDVAEKAIASGASVHDDDVFADYQSAAMNRRDQNVRQQESDAATDAANAADAPAAAGADTTGPDLGDKVVALLGWDKDPGEKKKAG